MLLIDEYKLQWLKGKEGKSQGTIQQYSSSIELFMKYMKERKDGFPITRDTVKRVKLQDVLGFLGSLVDVNSNGTRRNKISALKSLFGYCKIKSLKISLI